MYKERKKSVGAAVPFPELGLNPSGAADWNPSSSEHTSSCPNLPLSWHLLSSHRTTRSSLNTLPELQPWACIIYLSLECFPDALKSYTKRQRSLFAPRWCFRSSKSPCHFTHHSSFAPTALCFHHSTHLVWNLFGSVSFHSYLTLCF